MLDMGEPVRILDLARNLLRLAGVRGDLNERIVFSGLRAGEKLHEELVAPDESMYETKITKVKVLETSSSESMRILPEVQGWERELEEGREGVMAALWNVLSVVETATGAEDEEKRVLHPELEQPHIRAI